MKGLARRGAIVLMNPGPRTKPAIPALIDLLGDPDEFFRTRAFDILHRMGKLSVPALIAATKRPSELLHGNAAAALGNIGVRAKDAVPALTEAHAQWTGWPQTIARNALAKIAGEYPRQLEAH